MPASSPHSRRHVVQPQGKKRGETYECTVYRRRDDFTGSNDTGIQFLKAGYDASVILVLRRSPRVRAESRRRGYRVAEHSRQEAVACLKTVAEYLLPLRGKK
jgi:hypothetical protein